MESLQGKHFSITDQKNVNTIIYQVNKTSKTDVKNGASRFSVERLEFSEELREDTSRKTFFVDDPKEEGNQLIILSFTQNKVVVNMGILQGDRVRISKKPMPVKFDTIYSENEKVYKEFKYTPNLKRPIYIIDPVTTEEVMPVMFWDDKTNKLKGKIELEPNKPYFAFEIREDKVAKQ